MKKLLNQSLLTILAFFAAWSSYAQELQSTKSKYERIGLTTVNFSYPTNKYNNRLKDFLSKVKPLDKYDDNSINVTEVSNSVDPILSLKAADKKKLETKLTDSIIKFKLDEAGLVRKVVAKLWNRKENGTFDLDVLGERMAYNANDAEFTKAKSSKYGVASYYKSGKNIKRIMDKTYIIVYDFSELKSYDDIYDETDAKSQALAAKIGQTAPKVPRLNVGYVATLKAYVYKLNWDQAIQGEFDEKMFMSSKDGYEEDYNALSSDQKKSKIDAFNSFKFPYTFVGSVTATGTVFDLTSTQQFFTDQQRFDNSLYMALENLESELAKKFDEFRVKAPISDVKPLRSKIGKKESIFTDQRFFVVENALNKKGESIQQRIAVTRVGMKISNNKGIANGETQPSTFYQTAGKKIEPGMLMVQKDDLGFSVYAGYTSFLLDGGQSVNTSTLPFLMGNGGAISAGVDVNVSKYVGKALRNSKFNMLPGVKAGISFFFQPKYYQGIKREYADLGLDTTGLQATYGNLENSLKTNRIGFLFNISKEWSFGGNLFFAPQIGIGYGIESITNMPYLVYGGASGYYKYDIESGTTLRTSVLLDPSVKFGFNILHNLQFVISGGYMLRVSSEMGENIYEGTVLTKDYESTKIGSPYANLSFRFGF